MIVPYGPIGPHSRLVDIINTRRISLKIVGLLWMNIWMTILNIFQGDPLSFRGGMDRVLIRLTN